MCLPPVRRKMPRTRPREWKRLVLTSSLIFGLPWHCAQCVKLADNSFEKRGSTGHLKIKSRRYPKTGTFAEILCTHCMYIPMSIP